MVDTSTREDDQTLIGAGGAEPLAVTPSAPPEQDGQMLKVSARSQPGMLAGAIAGVIRSGEEAHLQAIGAGAVNQAIKAIATASTYLAPEGVDIMCLPTFVQVDLDGAQRTAISLRVAITGPPSAAAHGAGG